jgi:hypothetical protein
MDGRGDSPIVNQATTFIRRSYGYDTHALQGTTIRQASSTKDDRSGLPRLFGDIVLKYRSLTHIPQHF